MSCGHEEAERRKRRELEAGDMATRMIRYRDAAQASPVRSSERVRIGEISSSGERRWALAGCCLLYLLAC